MTELYVYPMMVLDDSILWQAIDAQGREHWSQMMGTSVDPLPIASRCKPGYTMIKCESSDNRVINALERSFL